MVTRSGRPSDDVWSAPESGTVRDETSGNQPSDRDGRPAPPAHEQSSPRNHSDWSNEDDSYVAGEER